MRVDCNVAFRQDLEDFGVKDEYSYWFGKYVMGTTLLNYVDMASGRGRKTVEIKGIKEAILQYIKQADTKMTLASKKPLQYCDEELEDK